MLLVLVDEFLDFLPVTNTPSGTPRFAETVRLTQLSCSLVISSPFSSSKRITDILFLFVGRCYVLKELDSGIVNLLRLGILGPLVASSLRSDNYNSRPQIPKRSRFTIPESNYYICMSTIVYGKPIQKNRILKCMGGIT